MGTWNTWGHCGQGKRSWGLTAQQPLIAQVHTRTLAHGQRQPPDTLSILGPFKLVRELEVTRAVARANRGSMGERRAGRVPPAKMREARGTRRRAGREPAEAAGSFVRVPAEQHFPSRHCAKQLKTGRACGEGVGRGTTSYMAKPLIESPKFL